MQTSHLFRGVVLLTCCAGLLDWSASAARAEAWPTLEELASPRFPLIVHVKVEPVQGRKMYKVLAVWQGEYGPSAFAKQPPTGYIDTLGPDGGAAAHEPGTEAVLFYTLHNRPKQGFDRHDMALLVRNGKLLYPPGVVEYPPGGRDYTVQEFRQQIASRVEIQRLKGTWNVVSVNFPRGRGEADEIAQRFQNAELTFAEHFTVLGQTFLGHALALQKKGEGKDEIRIFLAPTKTPKELNLLLGEVVGEGGLDRTPIATLRGIYQLDGDGLKICTAASSLLQSVNGPQNTEANQRPTRFDADLGVLVTLKRMADKKPVEEEEERAQPNVNNTTATSADDTSPPSDLFGGYPRSEAIDATFAWHRQTGDKQLRLTWFLRGQPQVAMRCLADLTKYQVTTFRDVHNHAIQSENTRDLSQSQVISIGKLLAEPPPSADPPPLKNLLILSFVEGGKRTIRLYDRDQLPREILRLYDLTGAMSPEGTSDGNPAEKSKPQSGIHEGGDDLSDHPILSIMAEKADAIARVKAVLACRVLRLGEEVCVESLQVKEALKGDVKPGQQLLTTKYTRRTVDDAGQPLPDPGMRLPVESGKEYVVFLRAEKSEYVLLDSWAGVLPYRPELAQRLEQPTADLLLWPADEKSRDFARLLKQIGRDSVRVQPVGSHPLNSNRTVDVPLPPQTPYPIQSEAERLYRLGYAIGYMESRNGKFAAHARYSEYGKAWMSGWSKGWKAADTQNTNRPKKEEPSDGSPSTAASELDRLNKGGFSRLHSAAIAGHLDSARQLLEAGADPNVRQEKFQGTPLQYAAAAGHLDVVRLLIKHGADVNSVDTGGRTPLMWAAKEGRSEVVQELLKAGAAPDPAGMIERADVIARVQAVLVPIRDVKDADWREYLLVIDPIKGPVKPDQTLLEHNFLNPFPYSDLEPKPQLPVENGKEYIAFLKQTPDGQKPGYELLDPWGGVVPYEPRFALLVRQAADRPDQSEEPTSNKGLDQIKDKAALDINQLNDKGFSKLHYAAMAGNVDSARQLLEAGVNPNVRQEKFQGTPLQYAAKEGHLDIVRLLLKHNAMVDAADSIGRTPLMWAAMEGRTQVVRELLQAGANAEAATAMGWTAARYALDKGHQETAKVLKEKESVGQPLQKPAFDEILHVERDKLKPAVYLVLTLPAGQAFEQDLAMVGSRLDAALKIAEEANDPDITVVFFRRTHPQDTIGAYSGFTIKQLKAIAALPADERASGLLEHAWTLGRLPRANTPASRQPDDARDAAEQPAAAQPEGSPSPSEPTKQNEVDGNGNPAAAEKAIRTLQPAHAGPITSIAFAPDGRLLATAAMHERGGHAPNLIKLWNPQTAELLRTLKPAIGDPPIDDEVSAMVFSPDGGKLAVSGGVLYHGQVVILDVKTGQLVWSHQDVADWTYVGIAFSPDGRLLASTGIARNDDGTRRKQQIHLWDVATGKLKQTLDGHEGMLMSVAFAPDGKSLASASSNGAVDLWDVKTGRVRRRLRAADYDPRAAGFVSVAFAPDGKWLAVSHSDGALRIWNPEDGTLQRELPLGERRPRAIAFSPNGELLATANWVEESISFWDVRTGKEHALISKADGGGTIFAFSPDGKSLATGSKEGAVRLVPTGDNE